jgi:hypothetical protein
MGRIVDLGHVRMRTASAMSVGQVAHKPGVLAIRLKPLTADDRESMGLPREAEWAWAVVYETKGDSNPDALLLGGWTSSQTEALAVAHEEFKKQEAALRRARERGAALRQGKVG